MPLVPNAAFGQLSHSDNCVWPGQGVTRAWDKPTAALSYSAGQVQLTDTHPTLIPSPKADCFDCVAEFWKPLVSQPEPIVGMLEFEEFEGLRPVTPLLVVIEYCDGYYIIKHQEFGLFGRGSTTADAVEDFLDYLVADYEAYAEESDEILDTNALRLAQRYRTLFRKS